MCAQRRFWQTQSDGRAKGAQHAAHGTSRRLPSCRIPQPERQRAYARSTTARARAKSSTRRAIVGHFMRARAIPAPHARLSPIQSGLCHVHPVPMLLSAFDWWRGHLARLTPPPRHHLRKPFSLLARAQVDSSSTTGAGTRSMTDLEISCRCAHVRRSGLGACVVERTRAGGLNPEHFRRPLAHACALF